MQGPQTQISARLRDFIVLNADSKSIHKKVCSVINSDFCETESTTSNFHNIILYIFNIITILDQYQIE